MRTLPDPGIKGYDLLEPLGNDEFVYLSRPSEGDDRSPVVVKLLDRTVEPVLPRRFDRSRRALENLIGSGSRFVPLVDNGTARDGHDFIVTRHFSDGSLADRLDAGPIKWDDALDLILDVTAIVADAHNAGLALGDIRPSAVLFDHGVAYLAVYGSATRRFDDGLPTYRAPELEGAGAETRTTPACDVFSLASILAALIAGRPIERRESVEDFLSDLPADACPSELAEIIDHALSTDPMVRFRDASTLRRALERLVADDDEMEPTAGELGETIGGNDPPAETIELGETDGGKELDAETVELDLGDENDDQGVDDHHDRSDLSDNGLPASLSDLAVIEDDGRRRALFNGAPPEIDLDLLFADATESSNGHSGNNGHGSGTDVTAELDVSDQTDVTAELEIPDQVDTDYDETVELETIADATDLSTVAHHDHTAEWAEREAAGGDGRVEVVEEVAVDDPVDLHDPDPTLVFAQTIEIDKADLDMALGLHRPEPIPLAPPSDSRPSALVDHSAELPTTAVGPLADLEALLVHAEDGAPAGGVEAVAARLDDRSPAESSTSKLRTVEWSDGDETAAVAAGSAATAEGAADLDDAVGYDYDHQWQARRNRYDFDHDVNLGTRLEGLWYHNRRSIASVVVVLLVVGVAVLSILLAAQQLRQSTAIEPTSGMVPTTIDASGQIVSKTEVPYFVDPQLAGAALTTEAERSTTAATSTRRSTTLPATTATSLPITTTTVRATTATTTPVATVTVAPTPKPTPPPTATAPPTSGTTAPTVTVTVTVAPTDPPVVTDPEPTAPASTASTSEPVATTRPPKKGRG